MTVRPVSRWLLVTVGCAGVATVGALVAEGQLGLFEPASGVNLWLGLLPGVVWLGAGIVAWALRPASPAGPLMTAVGFACWAEPSQPASRGAAVHARAAALGPAAGVRGPPVRRFPRGCGEVAARAAVDRGRVPRSARCAYARPVRDPERDFRCRACPENLLLVEANEGAADAVLAIGNAVGVVLGVMVVLLGRRWRAATPAARRALAPVLGAALVTVVLFVPFLASVASASRFRRWA